MQESIFDKLDFGPMRPLLDNDDITDISYCNGGQIWIRSLTQGSMRVEIPGCTPEFMEKLAFQCSNVMGTTFNNAKPFLDAESSELRLNFVHDSIATNGIACVIRKTPAKIRLEKEKLLKEDYFTADIHDILIQCVLGHCNIIVAGETGSGKTEFVKYLASHTRDTEKIITIEDTLELHLDRIFPKRDIVAMKTNNVASYTDVLVTCMRQNPKWILLSEVRSAEAVTAVRNSISSGHNILSTIHADKASAIPYRLYSLLESDIDVEQFLTTIYRYIQIGVHIKAYYSKKYGKFHREVDEVVEFFVDENNKPQSHTIYRKIYEQEPIVSKPSPHLIEYLANQNVDITNIVAHMPEDDPLNEGEMIGNTSGENINNAVEEEGSYESVDNNNSMQMDVSTQDFSTPMESQDSQENINVMTNNSNVIPEGNIDLTANMVADANNVPLPVNENYTNVVPQQQVQPISAPTFDAQPLGGMPVENSNIQQVPTNINPNVVGDMQPVSNVEAAISNINNIPTNNLVNNVNGQNVNPINNEL